MKYISPNDSLNETIALLETKRDLGYIELKHQFQEVHESLKPIHFIKDTLKSLTTPSDAANVIDKTTIGLAAGFLVKNIIFRNSSHPMKILTRVTLQTLASTFAVNHADKIVSSFQNLLHALLSKLNQKND